MSVSLDPPPHSLSVVPSSHATASIDLPSPPTPEPSPIGPPTAQSTPFANSSNPRLSLYSLRPSSHPSGRPPILGKRKSSQVTMAQQSVPPSLRPTASRSVGRFVSDLSSDQGFAEDRPGFIPAHLSSDSSSAISQTPEDLALLRPIQAALTRLLAGQYPTLRLRDELAAELVAQVARVGDREAQRLVAAIAPHRLPVESSPSPRSDGFQSCIFSGALARAAFKTEDFQSVWSRVQRSTQARAWVEIENRADLVALEQSWRTALRQSCRPKKPDVPASTCSESLPDQDFYYPEDVSAVMERLKEADQSDTSSNSQSPAPLSLRRELVAARYWYVSSCRFGLGILAFLPAASIYWVAGLSEPGRTSPLFSLWLDLVQEARSGVVASALELKSLVERRLGWSLPVQSSPFPPDGSPFDPAILDNFPPDSVVLAELSPFELQSLPSSRRPALDDETDASSVLENLGEPPPAGGWPFGPRCRRSPSTWSEST
jgi:hypothetical protein